MKDMKEHHGFTFNTRRGTAHFFSCNALFAFLERNGLSHVIRAHEVQEVGFQVRCCILAGVCVSSCEHVSLYVCKQVCMGGMYVCERQGELNNYNVIFKLKKVMECDLKKKSSLSLIHI